jgi:hypothetical protein
VLVFTSRCYVLHFFLEVSRLTLERPDVNKALCQVETHWSQPSRGIVYPSFIPRL